MKSIISLLFLFFSTICFSQVDTIKIAYSEESKDSSDFKNRKTYQYLDINQKNESHLIKFSPKIGIGNSVFTSFSAGFEQKVLESFSIYVFTNSSFSTEQYFSYKSFEGNLQSEIRWYPGLVRRINSGKSGNNLNGSYVGFGMADFVILKEFRLESLLPIPYISTGFQKRLNNWSYLDVFGNLSLTRSSWIESDISERLYFGMGIRIGFAWGNNK